MTVSTTDIANRALTRLGIKTFDNAVDAGIYEQITTSLTDLYEELYAVGTIDWQLNSIPAAAVGSCVGMCVMILQYRKQRKPACKLLRGLRVVS